jgi:hypothetical protein
MTERREIMPALLLFYNSQFSLFQGTFRPFIRHFLPTHFHDEPIILTASVYDFFEVVPEQLQKYTSFLKLSFPLVGNPSEEKKDSGQARMK